MTNVKERKTNFFKDYHYTLEQKRKFDDRLIKFQKQLISMVQDRTLLEGKHSKSSISGSSRKDYVPRKENRKILLEAIFSVMPSRKEMTMTEIMMTMTKNQTTVILIALVAHGDGQKRKVNPFM